MTAPAIVQMPPSASFRASNALKVIRVQLSGLPPEEKRRAAAEDQKPAGNVSPGKVSY